MGDIVVKEQVNMPTCGQMFDALRNIQELGTFKDSTIYIDGFPVALLTRGNIMLNGKLYCNQSILEKKPVKEGLAPELERLIGRHNGIALVNNTLIGLTPEDSYWLARRELHDSELLYFYSQILENNQIEL